MEEGDYDRGVDAKYHLARSRGVAEGKVDYIASLSRRRPPKKGKSRKDKKKSQ